MYFGETSPHFPHFHTNKNIRGGEIKLKITRNPDTCVHLVETSPHLLYFHTNKNQRGKTNSLAGELEHTRVSKLLFPTRYYV